MNIEKAIRRFAPLAAALAALLCYAAAIGNPLLWDDPELVMRGEAAWSEGFESALLPPGPASGKAYRPVVNLSSALLYALFEKNAAGWRTAVLLLHGAVSALLCLVLMRVFRGEEKTALGAALLFAVHPLHAEVAGAVAGLEEVLAALFFLLAWLSHLAAGDEKKAARRLTLRSAAGLLFLAALLSKEHVAALPAVLLLSDRVAASLEGRRWSLKNDGPPLLFPLSVLSLYLLLRLHLLGEVAAVPLSAVNNPLSGGSWEARLLTGLHLARKGVVLFLWPARLSVDYSFPEIPPLASLADPRAPAALLFAAGTIFAAFLLRRRPAFLLGLGFFLLVYFPVSNVPFLLNNLFSEPRLYLPSAGLSLAVADLAFGLTEKFPARRKALAAAFALTLLVLGIRTVLRNADRSGPYRLARSSLRAAPRCARLHRYAGVTLVERGFEERGEKHLLEAVRLNPRYAVAWTELGRIVQRRGEAARAAELFRKALATDPENARAWNDLGVALAALGERAEARRAFSRALELEPGMTEALGNLKTLGKKRR